MPVNAIVNVDDDDDEDDLQLVHAVHVCNVQAEINRSYTKHRKIASSFRDTQLFEIFELGINLLKKAYEMIKTVDYSDADQVSKQHCFSSFLYTLEHVYWSSLPPTRYEVI